MRTPLFLTLLAAGFPGGFLLGAWRAPAPSAAERGTAAATGESASTRFSGPPPRRDAGRVGGRLSASALGGAEGLAAALAAARGDATLWSCLLSTWRQKDPGRLMRALARQAAEEVDPEIHWRFTQTASFIAADMAGTDPAAAVRAAEALDASSFRDSVLAAVVMRILPDDPARALDLAAVHPEIRLGGLPVFAPGALSADLIPKIRKLPRSELKEQLLTKALIDNLSPAEAMAETEKETGVSRQIVAAAVARNFAARDFEAAKAAAVGADSFATRAALSLAVGEYLAETDPPTAMRWADEHLAPTNKNGVLEKALNTLNQRGTDPGTAAEIRARLPGN